MTETADPPPPMWRPTPLVEPYDGSFDLADGAALSLSLDRIVNHSGTVVLDMTAVEFLSTSALSLLAGFGHSRHVAGLATLIVAGPRVRRPLEVSGVTEWIVIVDGRARC